ncbi:MAG: hypothetical protein QW609_04060 [Candidatus Aenigmatarchaeota archaeon]
MKKELPPVWEQQLRLPHTYFFTLLSHLLNTKIAAKEKRMEEKRKPSPIISLILLLTKGGIMPSVIGRHKV